MEKNDLTCFWQQVRKLLQVGRAAEALAQLENLEQRLLADGDLAQYRSRLYELRGAAYSAQGEGVQAAACYFEAARSDRYLAAQLAHYSSYLFGLHYGTALTDEEMDAEHLRYGGMLAGVRRCRFTPQEVAETGLPGQRKLRIGYLSPDYHKHTMAHFMQAFFAMRQAEHFTAVACSLSSVHDAVTEQYQDMADVWLELDGLSQAEAVEKIKAARIDILLDLGGHTDGGRSLLIMAAHPAPVTVSGLGWIDTTGLEAVDYLLLDSWTLPAAGCRLAETPLVLPTSLFCWATEREQADTSAYRAPALAEITFGCLANFAKITDEILELWQNIIEISGAHLLLQDTTPYPERQEQMRARLRKAGFASGSFTIFPGQKEYHKRLQDIDIWLDTYPYVGGGMVAEALACGVPVVSRYGTRVGTRFARSILHNAGLGELAVATDDAYVRTAVELAKDRVRLTHLHRTLPEQLRHSALMEQKRYMRELEGLYTEIWQRWLQEEEKC